MIIVHHGLGVTKGIEIFIEENSLKQVKPSYEKLNAEEVKNLVADLKIIYPDKNPCLIAGPLDEADPSNLDTLLKIVEEPLPNTPTLILWAYDFGSVPSTIRSRCGEKYWFAPEQDHSLLNKANLYLDAILIDRNYNDLISLLKEIPKGSERSFIDACCESILKNESLKYYQNRFVLFPIFKRHLMNKRISKLSLYSLTGELIQLDLSNFA